MASCYLLKSGATDASHPLRIIFKKDLDLAAKVINGEPLEENIQETFSAEPLTPKTSFSKSTLLGLDCEWDANRNLTMIGISDGKRSFYITGESFKKTPRIQKKLKEILGYEKRIIVLANRPVDENILKEHGIKIKAKKVDVFPLSNIVDENLPLKLESIAEAYTPFRRIKDVTKTSNSLSFFADETNTLGLYCARDACATVTAYKELLTQVKTDAKLYRYYKYFIVPITETLAQLGTFGLAIDKQKLQQNIKTVEKELAEIEEELIAQIPPGIKRKHKDKLSLTRRDLIRDILYSRLGFKYKPEVFTPTGAPATSEEALKKYKEHPW